MGILEDDSCHLIRKFTYVTVVDEKLTCVEVEQSDSRCRLFLPTKRGHRQRYSIEFRAN